MTTRKRQLPRSAGYTLLEAMVTLVILSILVGIGVPSFRALIVNQQVRGASFDLSTTLLYARAEAARRANNVTVAAIDGDWRKGWQITGGGAVLQRHAALSNVDVATNYSSIVFNRSGRVGNLVAGQVPQFTLTSTTDNDSVERCLRIDPSGRVGTTC